MKVVGQIISNIFSFFVAFLDLIGSGLDGLPLVDGLDGVGLALRTEERLVEQLAPLRV